MFDKKRILAIDDSMAIRSYLCTVLTKQGAVVDGAATGQAGLEALRHQSQSQSKSQSQSQPVDLVLIDLILPDIGGIEVLRRIRAEDQTVTVVILTGAGGIKSAISAVQLGADAYVEKQDISSEDGLIEFYHILQQAMARRGGLVAQKQLAEAKADFYSMVTHDLRNPAGYIQTAIQMLDLLLQNPMEADIADRDELVEIIRLAADKLMGLINDYLDFAKIDAGYLKLSKHQVDLVQIADDTIHLIKIQAQARHQKLVLDLPPGPVMAYVDADKFRQVLDNLLSNAVKYTSVGGTITLALRVEGDEAIFTVSDTGQGIHPTQIPALFTKYHRVPGNATLGIAGSGLGLLIVKEIVEAHNGSVEVTSTGVAGQGATFTTRIPLGM